MRCCKLQKFTIFEIFLFALGLLTIGDVWINFQVSLENQLVPTVVNGMTASISLIVGFTGALIVSHFLTRYSKDMKTLLVLQ